SFPGLKGADLAKVVSVKKGYEWKDGTWSLEAAVPPDANRGHRAAPTSSAPFNVVAYDFGVKRNILRILVDLGCKVTVVPAQTPADKVLAMKPDGLFLANGPGDPEPCDYAIAATREFLERKIPVLDLESGRVMITSQNHGFAVDEASLPANVRATQRSLFDNTSQGIEFTDRPAYSFQGHPEASPGPHDAKPLFDKFIQMMEARRA
ncbi:MAG: carbamoyl-phosphate synthase small subunit, partial [Gammaproteobacteria bacterium]